MFFSLLQINLSLSLFDTSFGNHAQSLQTTKDRTSETFLSLFEVEGGAVSEFQGYIDDAGGVVSKFIQGFSVLVRSAIVADVQNVDDANLCSNLRYMLVPWANILFPDSLRQQFPVTTLAGYIEAVSTTLTSST
jgi:hypothetical protein